MREVRIKRIMLSDVGPFFELTIDFPAAAGLNLICGGNGIGKSTILAAIAASFALGTNHQLKRRQSAIEGLVEIDLVSDSSIDSIRTTITSFDPARGDFVQRMEPRATSIIFIRAARDFEYQAQSTIDRDPKFISGEFAQSVAQGLRPQAIKSWFTNRYLLQHHAQANSWTAEMQKNLDLAISCFSILDKTVKLSDVDVRSFDIMVSTPSGRIPFEFLSSGFKSAYALLLGIIREIETRDLNVSAADFCGVILIDEIDLHLHPTWQQKIGSILKECFPSAQFIATTHSPHVIQSAKATEVLPLVLTSDGRVVSRNLSSSQFGFAGWTIEEILEDIMGLPDAKTAVFRGTIQAFDAAVDAQDKAAINRAKQDLHEMLHPKNPLRKLIDIQAAPFL